MSRILRQVLQVGLCASVAFLAAQAHADIPADYLGTPYKGIPSAIPGRVDLVNVDLGGAEISYHADHNRMNSAGYEPISGNDYRPDEKDLPNICKTNGANPDHWVADGTVYPSEANPTEYYIGYAHAVDWVKVTVNVAQAGKYNVSSNWASDGAKAGLSIWFNDGHSAVDPKHPKDGVNKSGVVILDGTSDVHKWRAYPKFASVELSAGLQVMTFHLEQFDHLQYGYLQFDLDGAPASGGGDGTAGASAAAGATSGGAGGVGGGAAVAGSSSGGASGGADTGTAGAVAGPGGATAAGAPNAVAGAPSANAGNGASSPEQDSGGCRVSIASAHLSGARSPAVWLALLAVSVLIRRRRQR